jgi:hypothetical protein
VRRRRVAVVAMTGGIVLWFMLGAAPAGAVELDGGCEGSGVSLTEDGDEIDEATAPSDDVGTEDEPFEVDYDGTVTYEGTSPSPFEDHSWHIDILGIEVDSGGSANEAGDTEDDGDVVVEDYLPFKTTGLYYVEGAIEPEEGEGCSGSMYVKLVGSPVGTIPWIAGLVLTAGGFALVVGSYPTGAKVLIGPPAGGPPRAEGE